MGAQSSLSEKGHEHNAKMAEKRAGVWIGSGDGRNMQRGLHDPPTLRIVRNFGEVREGVLQCIGVVRRIQ